MRRFNEEMPQKVNHFQPPSEKKIIKIYKVEGDKRGGEISVLGILRL